MYNIINFNLQLFQFCSMIHICLINVVWNFLVRHMQSVSSVRFTGTFQCQSVILICILHCQNPVQQGLSFSLLAISFIKSLGGFFLLIIILMRLSSSDTLCFKICCLCIDSQACPSPSIALISMLIRLMHSLVTSIFLCL